MDVLPVLVSIRLNSSTYILPFFGKIYNRKTDYFDFFVFIIERGVPVVSLSIQPKINAFILLDVLGAKKLIVFSPLSDDNTSIFNT